MIPRKPLGDGGPPVPVLGIGTWEMEKAPREDALASIRRALDLGMRHVDTAEMYGGGRAEEIVSEAIAGRRDDVFLVSKVLPTNASRKGTVTACERTLQRLGVERLDLYLLHWPGSHALDDTIDAFEQLEADGKIAAFGVSNFDVAELEEAVKIAGPRKIACNQVLYNLEERAIEHAVLPWCERHGIAVVGYSPFGQGAFPSPTSRGGALLAEIAAAHRATPRQVALAFLTRRESLFAIPKASSVAHVEENAGAVRVRLDDADLARLYEAFPLGRARALPTA